MVGFIGVTNIENESGRDLKALVNIEDIRTITFIDDTKAEIVFKDAVTEGKDSLQEPFMTILLTKEKRAELLNILQQLNLIIIKL